ncbi:inaD-like protein isoform X2 [Hippocampus zosterae]|uniref:inaD-like protein isoform X2 n=1 Tax=Hippocampus zosterae TaxID=109293 RepID=UPI00223DA2CC|nr:inaD-like protein isoform X2 [Hippocampus zosterae]
MPDEAGPGPVRPSPAGTVPPDECRRAAAALERLRAKLTEEEEWRGHVARVAALRETLDSPLFAHVLALQRAVAHLEEQLSPPLPEGSRRSGFGPNGASAAGHASPPSSAAPADDSAALVLEAPPSPDRLRRWIATAAAGRPTERVHLTRPASGGLGFSVAGLHPGSGGPDVFVQHIQPGGVADRDGRLQLLDQILAINGRPLEAGVSLRQASAWLQMPGRAVDLTVARDRPPGDTPPQTSLPSQALPTTTAANVNAIRRAQPGISTSSAPPADVPSPARDCGATFSEVEEIQLLNDGSGLGFGIVGGKSGGAVVRTLVGGGVAARDGRLRAGDRILRIGATPTDGLSSDEVVQVLRACGSRVTMLVARGRGDRESGAPPPPPPPPPDSAPVTFPLQPRRRPDKTPNLDGYEIHEVALTKKDGESLGISIIGQNPLSSHDAVGVFIKHVVPGSAAHHSGNIRVQDRLIALDGVSLHGLTNREVVEVMKGTGRTVLLTLVRRNNATAAERSLDRVESSRGSLRRSPDLKMTYLDTHNSTPEAALKAKWQKALGPNQQVLVVKLHPAIEDHARPQRSSKLLPVHTLRLGLELDSFDGRHYLSCVLPGGPADKDGVLRAEDQLLEVNRVPLCGKSRREVLAFLKEATPPFTLVCCRRLTSESEAENESEGRGGGLDDEREEEGGELALWSSQVDVLELRKEAGQGLGFSILDYQDPLDPGGCVMVIRSLVAGGAAERAGALLPGDQLVSVNDVRLEGLSLERAVDVLKGAPPGVVRLGLRKPLVGWALGPAEEEAGLARNAGPSPAPSSPTSDPAGEEEDEGGEMAVDDDETETTGTTAPPSWERRKAASSDTRQTKDGALPGETLISPAINPTQDARTSPRDAEADSELSSTDTESVVRMIDAEKRRRRSHGGFSAATRGGGELPQREQGEGEETPRFSHWGPPRRVEVRPEAGESLGLSIVGGHHVIKRLRNGEELKGIFIKQVLRGSPAHATRALKTGDKILQVSGVDLRAASHEEAVQAIKSAESPVVFVVQSLSANPRMVRGAPPPYRPPGQSERDLLQAPQEPWRDLPGELLRVELDKEAGGGAGLSLAGKRDRRALGVFVAGLRPGGAAATDGRVRVGDRLLQVTQAFGRSSVLAVTSMTPTPPRRGRDGIRHEGLPLFPPPPESVSPPAGDPLVPAEWPHPPESDVFLLPSEEDTDAEVVGARRENDSDDDPEEASVTTCESDGWGDDDDIGAGSPDARAGSPASRDPSTRPVLPGRETTLEIRKGRSGLGLSVAGGADTQLRAVVILEVYGEGAAAKDGRLLPGDRILEVRAHASAPEGDDGDRRVDAAQVNGADLRRASHEEAVAALRRPCSKVAVKVLRCAETDQLRREAGRGPGFGVAGNRSGRGTLVSEVARGGAADPDGRLTRGDGIPSVDGEDGPNATREAVAAILKLDDGGKSSKEVEEEEEMEGDDEDISCPARDTRCGSSGWASEARRPSFIGKR